MKKETKQVNEPTPVPWKLRVVRRNGDEDGYEIYSSDGRDVSTDGHMLNKTDAEFILRAANAHDELVTVLRVMVDHAKETYPHFESARGQADIKMAENVLAKVRP